MVAGAPFLALATVWHDTGIAAVGVVMLVVGSAGLVVAAIGTSAVRIRTISGVGSGLTLVVGSSAALIRREARRETSARRARSANATPS